MVCKECHAVCGSNARSTLCPTCERRLRSELAANMSPILRKAVEAAAAEVSVPYVSRIIQWFQLRAMEVREEAERLRGQLEKANQELTAAWGKCEVRRRNSLRYIAEIRRLRATKENLTIRLLRAAHANVELRGEVQGLKRRPPEVLTCHILDTSPKMLRLLDGARNYVTDPVLRAEITAICPPQARPTEAPE